MEDFEKELKLSFLDEANQLLTDVEQCFLLLESNPNDKLTLEKIFRLAHNLKGSAKAVGFDGLGEFTHELESFLIKLKEGKIPVQSSSIDLLLRCNDHISKMIGILKEDLNAKLDYADLITEIKLQQGLASSPALATVPSANQSQEEAEVKPIVAEQTMLLNQEASQAAAVQNDVFINNQVDNSSVALLQTLNEAFQENPTDPVQMSAALANTTEQMLASVTELPRAKEASNSSPSSSVPQSADSSGGGGGSRPVTDESIRVSLGRVEKLINFVGELVIHHAVLKEQIISNNPLLLKKTIHQMGKVTKEVQDLSMSLRMVPLKQTFQKMQRIVRDTSSTLGKKVNLVLSGEDTEVDKTVLESLSDPLVHLIRNAVDHGIESTEGRIAAGKIDGGEIHLKAYHQSGNLIVEVRDDGKGLNPKVLQEKAVEKGILKPNVTLSDREAYDLIFSSGFSTKSEVTDVSGRGVGMDVVKTNIEKLQGEIHIESQVGKGTCFRIQLPLTLAIIDGMLIRCQNERYIIPLSHVFESLRPQEKDVHYVTGVGEVLTLRGENLSIYRLDQLMGKKTTSKPISELIALVVRTQKHPFAIWVDDIISQQQVVIKQLGLEHQSLKGFSGSAILGDGCPALILELSELVSHTRVPSSTSQVSQLRRKVV